MIASEVETTVRARAVRSRSLGTSLRGGGRGRNPAISEAASDMAGIYHANPGKPMKQGLHRRFVPPLQGVGSNEDCASLTSGETVHRTVS